MSSVRFVGLDVHEQSITMAVAESDGSAPTVMRTIPHDLNALVRALKDLSTRSNLEVAYEAGSSGWGIFHKLSKAGINCRVVAPSRIPNDGRQKTDKEDAIRLARFLRSGDLVSVYVPDAEVEALRAVTRAREDAIKAQQRARGQLRQFLVREGFKYEGKSAWTKAHLEWVRSLKFDHSTKELVRDDYLREVISAEQRIARLTANVEAAAAVSPLAPVIKALQALRGVQLVTAATVAAEVGDFNRFKGAKYFMSFVGLVPREYSSGEREIRGSITKAGNAHLRRVIGEAAWNYRFGSTSDAIRKRRKQTTQRVQEIAERAQARLNHRWIQMGLRKKESNKIAIAIARELAGFIWAIGVAVQNKNANEVPA
jgi:transposase